MTTMTTILAAHRIDANHLIQVVQDDTYMPEVPLFWVQVRNAQTVVVEMHERGTEQAARTMANAIWTRLRKSA